MATKLPKDTFPSGHAAADFECFGPAATKDGEFESCRIADFGCFKQDQVDSNKYYSACVCKSRKTGGWYAYFEWGRVGAGKPSFQFIECYSEQEAAEEFADQCHSKNDKRGTWTTIAGIKTLQCKPGKDCYLVRPQATRSTGLPDARRIKTTDGLKTDKLAAASPAKNGNGSKPVVRTNIHPETRSLLRDFKVGTIQYTKSSMANAALPTQPAIDEARQVLQHAMQRVSVVGDNLQAQIGDRQLRDLTSLMYSRIPKIKPIGAPESSWLLTKDNIFGWQQDLDAFESALYAGDLADIEIDTDPYGGMAITLDYLESKTELGEFLYSWMPKATRNKHYGVGNMRIKHAWKVERHGVADRFQKVVDRVAGEHPSLVERPICQPARRSDLSPEDAKRYYTANVGMLFHGTRTVNTLGILREGLRMPKDLVGVVITGAMFGPGIYWADDWKKSAGYCSMRGSYWAGGGGTVKGRDAVMFVADVALGTAHVAPGPKGYTRPPTGSHCVFGKAGHSAVQNNEWIIFDTNQYQLRYLVEFTTA
jgi:hypothetical protein